MSDIDNNLLPDERILFRTKKHAIIFFFPALWTIFCFYATDYMQNDPILSGILLIPWLMAAVFWVYVALEYTTSQFVVTDRRVIMREGFFHRHLNETRLSTISQVSVQQNLFGLILNYGTVSINAFGAFDAFTLIARPVAFQKSVNEQQDRVIRAAP